MSDSALKRLRILSQRISSKKSNAHAGVPPIDASITFPRYTRRTEEDRRFKKQGAAFEHELQGQLEFEKYQLNNDGNDVLLKDPSYGKFKVPLDLICKDRYKKATKLYNDQFVKEINNLIDYQSSALEAAYFVRVMAYTTLWPPYHSVREIENTSRTFYSLEPKEKERLKYLLSHTIS